ncbi:unnamed protein product [Ceutorhynchus assimilis]|uniref:Caprin-1 dimerization domain-containing protein n=1 Tax=Ceutorhynchus assimilis TaxID=467358 RepID=A0A9N9MGK0_9CUCU|nr:unnamed protein product [Ceutorhynchus assimilis]
MPSAANGKIDKQISSSTENALVDTASMTPIRQAITTIEHKIRNLEKRKSKLESYRDMQNSGKELNTDQKTALAKINEVMMTLEFARDLYKQFLGIAASSERDAKKQAKREAALKNQAEMARLREILLVQDALNQMGTDGVRDDFLNGRNGAAQLTEADLKLLDDLYPAVTPKHESGNPTTFTNEVQAAAEHLLAVVDGKPKDVFGGTYSQVKEILGKIHESGYFDQAQESPIEEESVEVPVEPPVLDLAEPLVEVSSEISLAGPIETITIEASNHPAIINRAPQQAPISVVQALQMSPVPHVLDSVPPHHQPPPQEIFFQPQPQPPRPITEMLGTGNFFFLQESEIDTPEQISTQTFTNQTFMPPPIPLPSHFQPLPHTSPVNHQMPPNGAVQQQVPVQDEALSKPQLVDDLEKHSLGRAQNRGPSLQPTSFYNNGYTNRTSRPAPQQHSRNNNGVQQHHQQGRAQTNRH